VEEPAREIPYEGGVIPLGYKLDERVNKGLVVAGASVFGSLYGLSVLVGITGIDSNVPLELLLIPVIGPFVYMAEGSSPGANPILLLDGIGQATGAALLIAGVVAKKKVLIRTDRGSVDAELHVGPGSLGMKMTF